LEPSLSFALPSDFDVRGRFVSSSSATSNRSPSFSATGRAFDRSVEVID